MPAPGLEDLTKVVEIDGETYDIQMLDAVRGFRVYTKLLGAVGGVLENAGKLEGNPAELGLKLLGSALKSITPELAEELRSTFAAHSSVTLADGKKPQVKDVFLMHFRGRYLHMSKWLFECVKVNFADFLAEGSSVNLSALLGNFGSKSPSASTGSSTAR